MAYLHGFMATDGYVCKSGISISLQEKDKELVYNLSDWFSSIGWNPKINYREIKEKSYIRMRVHSRDLCEYFIDSGIFQNKSFNIEFNKNIPKNFIRHYIRGIFDGDGCLHHRRKNLEISFCSASKSFIEVLTNIIEKELKIKKKNIYTRKKSQKHNFIYEIRYYSRESLKLLSWIYKEPFSFFLKRKFDIWDNFSPVYKHYWDKKDFVFLNENINLSNFELASKLRRSENSIRKKKWEIEKGKTNLKKFYDKEYYKSVV